jgi:hypothetical protein
MLFLKFNTSPTQKQDKNKINSHNNDYGKKNPPTG